MTTMITQGWDADTDEQFELHKDPPTGIDDRKAIIAIMKKAHEDHSWERHLKWQEEYEKEYGTDDLPMSSFYTNSPECFSQGYEGIKLISWQSYGKPNRWGDDYWGEVEYCKRGYRATYGYSSLTGEANCYCD